MNTITASEKNLAAAAHLGYLLVLAAVALTVANVWLLLPSALILGLFAAWEMRNSHLSPFVAEHQRQARRHMSLGLMGAGALAAFAVWAGIFTWGIGTAMSVLVAPIMLLAWMVPTAWAVQAAMHGDLYEYKLERRLARSQKSDPVLA